MFWVPLVAGLVYYASNKGVKEWRDNGRKETTTAKRWDMKCRA